jgi:hypothetical protein
MFAGVERRVYADRRAADEWRLARPPLAIRLRSRPRCLPMSATQRSRIQALLAAETSPLRLELLRLVFDALAAQPLSSVMGEPDLAGLIARGLARDNIERITRRHVLPAVARVQKRLANADERVRDLLPKDAEVTLRALVASGKGPRFAWLKGAIDPNDLQKLITPIVQHVLTSFVTKLPIPGLSSSGGGSGSGSGGGSGGLGGFVGKIGKQVSKGASQLAGGLGLQQVVRDFSQSATIEVRAATVERLRSDEGREIMRRIRDRVLDHVLAARANEVVDDFLRASPQQIGRIAEGAVSHVRDLQFFRDILTGEIQAALAEVGARSLRDLLDEMGLLDGVRKVALDAVEPGLVDLVRTDAFGDWLDRILAQSSGVDS